MRDIDIEELLIWTYRDQRAHVAARTAPDRPGWGPSLLARAIERARLGCAIDGGGYAPAASHPDADLVHLAVLRLCDTPEELGLVVQHACGGTRPDDGGGIELRATLDYVEYDRSRHAKVCWLRWQGTDSELAFARQVWLLWWEAVDLVGAHLRRNAGLRAHRVTGFACPREPWNPQGLTQAKKLDSMPTTMRSAR